MLLTVATLVLGARSVDFLLLRVGIPKVIRVIGSPLLIGPLLLLAATVRSTTGLLPLLEPRMGMKPATTERTPSPREHTFPSPEPRKQKEKEGARKEKKQKGKALLEPIRRTRKENSEDEEHCPNVGRLSGPRKVSQEGPPESCPGQWRLPRILRTTSLSIWMLNAKAICWAIRGQPQLGLRCFISTTAWMSSALGPFGPGFRGRFCENSMRYFCLLKAL
jgi:hypothetical protein